MTTFAPDKPQRRNVMITDLDQSDSQLVPPPQSRRAAKKNLPEKQLLTIAGNFKRRSRSVDCELKPHRVDDCSTKPPATKTNNYFNELLQSKEKQMNQLLQRLGTLHEFNQQFAEENKNLRNDVQLLEEKIAQLKERIKDCANCRKFQKQVRRAQGENKTANNDLNMLKTLVYRLNVQIEHYQDRLRNDANSNINASTANAPDAPPAVASACDGEWKDSMHTTVLAPLLNSYDEMLKERQELIQQYKQEFEAFTDEMKTVLEENTKLQHTNDNLKRDIGGWREERTRLQAQLEVCRSKAEAQTRKSDLAKEKLVEVMQCYEQKVQSLLLDKEHLQSAYTRCKSELVSLKSLSAQPQDSIALRLQECKELLEHLKAQHCREKSSLENQVVELREELAAEKNKSQQQKAKNSELKEAIETHEKQLKAHQRQNATLERTANKAKRSRDRLKARLRIALQWAQKLEDGQANMQTTWDALKHLETVVKHKEAQVRGLHARHLEELEKMQHKLDQKEEMIRKILRGKLDPSHAR